MGSAEKSAEQLRIGDKGQEVSDGVMYQWRCTELKHGVCEVLRDGK